ncbi:MAG: MoaD/ThiS family protein [Crenarchaeota archaeon]|nr:MoaD/ThiS family protein [Thermoproteota archaeon]MDW8034005.1 MoaD/ThiS family protein [Nitrososphaerota archaeon]
MQLHFINVAGVNSMRIKAFIQRVGETKLVDLDEGSRVEDLLKVLGISVSEVVPVKNGVIVTEREILRDGDEIKLLSVVSGG